ncbi:MAG TPA: CaiB/BaiF CoA-transferase family protein, partial [Acidimicrobiia bacterium]
DVIRVHRVGDVPAAPPESPSGREAQSSGGAVGHHSEWDRGRRSIAIDLKQSEGVELLLTLAERVDALCESFRPGVAERLGVGPDAALARNPKLVYGRLTGWGQEGPLAQAAAHSINYESIVGAVGSIGPVGGPPVSLLQVLGDFAGGGMHLAFGVVCALLEAQRSGRGQVVDVAMVDGVASIYTPFYSMARSGMHTDDIGTNLFDGGAPFYNVYETADGKFVSVAPIEPHFYAVLLDKLGVDPASLPDQYDRGRWPEVRDRFAAIFRERTRDEWCALLEGTDACFAPVMRLGEAPDHAHNVARHMFVPGADGRLEVAPAPRFSRTPGAPRPSYRYEGADTDAVLTDLGVSADNIATLRATNVIA